MLDHLQWNYVERFVNAKFDAQFLRYYFFIQYSEFDSDSFVLHRNFIEQNYDILIYDWVRVNAGFYLKLNRKLNIFFEQKWIWYRRQTCKLSAWVHTYKFVEHAKSAFQSSSLIS